MSFVKIVIYLTMLQCVQHDPCLRLSDGQKPPIQQRGQASFYGAQDDSKMYGARTASGELFRPREHTLASRTIPLGTTVWVENRETQEGAWCRVNDRGPYAADFPDGSWGIKMHRNGQTRIRRWTGSGWADPEYKPLHYGSWRAIADLSVGCARAIGFDFDHGFHPVTLRYWPPSTLPNGSPRAALAREVDP